MCAYVYICTYVYIYIYIHIDLYIYICVHAYMYMYICDVCVYMYTHAYSSTRIWQWAVVAARHTAVSGQGIKVCDTGSKVGRIENNAFQCCRAM